MDTILDQTVALLFDIFAPIIAALIAGLLARALQYVNVSLSIEKQRETERRVMDILLQVEEHAADYIKRGGKFDGREKYAKAKALLLDRGLAANVSDVDGLIKSGLAKLGLGASAPRE